MEAVLPDNSISDEARTSTSVVSTESTRTIPSLIGRVSAVELRGKERWLPQVSGCGASTKAADEPMVSSSVRGDASWR